MTSIVELRKVTKEYGSITALDSVDLRVESGEALVLVGPNGSGKTTLLRIIAGIETPTQGEVYFKGTKADSDFGRLTKSATMVFQKTIMFSGTVRDNIVYGLKLKGQSKNQITAAVKKALETVKLEGFEKRSAKRLSGGEQQRVAIARALALDTQILLLDEPTANIDPRNASIIENVLQSISRQKKTIIIATQNMAQAQNLADRVAVLSRGRIDKIGRFREVFSSPSTFLADFARLENVFEGNARITEEGTSFVDVGNGVNIIATFEKSGNVTIYVRPEDIILSVQPLISSARNVFKGRIAEISDSGSTVRLKVNAGKDFSVQVTRKSFDGMKLNLDSSVFLAFKASSVQII